MAFWDKLMFWKKNDDLDGDLKGLDDLGGMNNMPPLDALQSGQPQNMGQQTGQQQPAFQQSGSNPSAFSQQAFQQQAPQSRGYFMDNVVNDKDLQLISSKLDALKASMDNIDQRLRNIERIAQMEFEKSNQRW